MTTRSESYRFRDNKTPLSAEELNARFFDLDKRLHQVEQLESQLAEEVNKFSQLGLDRIAEVVDPAVAEAYATIDDANDLIESVNESFATGTQLDAQTSWADAVAVTYDGSDRVETITETIGESTKVVTLSYDGSGRVDTVQTDWDGVRRTETMTYNPDGTIASVSTTEVDL